ncbi:MAG: hypothetical protein IJS08_10315, partial [Victivallales bacterium]|nr:hypothetical protein [Victivallales bacterium]
YDGARASSKTDDFSLAVMLYKMLHLRHPFLREPYANDFEAQEVTTDKDGMPRAARRRESFVYIESEHNTHNRYTKTDVLNGLEEEQKEELLPYCFPWFDLEQLPSRKVVGERMAELFRQAFDDYLFDPENRPTAEEWEKNLIRTEGRMMPCSNPSCLAGAFLWDEFNYDRSKQRFVCPFCGTAVSEKVLTICVIEHRDDKRWRWRIAVLANQTRKILRWEMGGYDPNNRAKFVGDQLEDESLLEPVAEISYSGGRFCFRNCTGADLFFIHNGIKKILSNGESTALGKDDCFYVVENRFFHVLGTIG